MEQVPKFVFFVLDCSNNENTTRYYNTHNHKDWESNLDHRIGDRFGDVLSCICIPDSTILCECACKRMRNDVQEYNIDQWIEEDIRHRNYFLWSSCELLEASLEI